MQTHPTERNLMCMLPVAVARSSSAAMLKYVMYFRFCERQRFLTVPFYTKTAVVNGFMQF